MLLHTIIGIEQGNIYIFLHCNENTQRVLLFLWLYQNWKPAVWVSRYCWYYLDYYTNPCTSMATPVFNLEIKLLFQCLIHLILNVLNQICGFQLQANTSRSLHSPNRESIISGRLLFLDHETTCTKNMKEMTIMIINPCFTLCRNCIPVL